MTSPDAFLDRIRIASPCDASWDAMRGNDRRRFCGDCKLHVYNLSAMTRTEAEGLLRRAAGQEGRLCTRFARRADGTLVTQDCGPVRLAIRRRLQRLRAVAATVFAALSSFALAACGQAPAATGADGPTTTQTDPTDTTTPVLVPVPDHPPLMGAVAPDELMGEVCLPDETMGRVASPDDPRIPPKDGE